ncbi:VOC family protein [Kocuria sp. M4R2S49]|uniref:VOC family protein n=1 Tax=Kocuria rhizosphaericola TaxID=3376284 RepID=UPI0037A74B5B
MITNVASAVLYVGDQEEALAFYRDTLGFDVVADADMGEGARWIGVSPRRLVLSPARTPAGPRPVPAS